MFGWERIAHNVKNAYVFTLFYWAARSILFQQVISGYVFVLTNSNKPVGVIKGIQGISQLVFSIPSGYFGDRVRRDTILKGAGAIGLATAILTIWAIEATHLQSLYIAFGLWGFFAAFQSPTMEALFADSIPHGERSYPFMIKYNVSNVAQILGPAMCVVLFLYYGDEWKIHELQPVLVFGALLAVISSILLFRFDDDLAYENIRERNAQDVEMALVERPLRTPTSTANDLDIEYDYSDGVEASATKTKSTESSALLQNDEPEEGHLLNQDVRFLCFRSHHVPWILFCSDFIIMNGAGMTVNFFPLFFMQEYGLTPIHMSLLFVSQPLLVMVLSIFSQRMSITLGRMPVIASTRILALLCLMAMSVAKPLWLEITFFLMRGGMMRCSQPLRRSLLMDYVPKNVRARWNALEGLSVFSWSGSAVLGGYIIDAYGYRMCFMITSAVYCVGLGLELFLLPLTRYAVEKKTSTAHSILANQKSTNTHAHSSIEAVTLISPAQELTFQVPASAAGPAAPIGSMFGWERIAHNVKNAYVFTLFYWAARSILFQQVISGYVFVLTNSNKPVGIIKGIQGISQLVFSIPAGYFGDHMRRDTILKGAGAIGLATSLLTIWAIEATHLQSLYIAFGLWGFFAAFQSPTMEALFADSIPHGERSYPFMIKYNVSNVAQILGPAMCVVLFLYYGDEWKIHELQPVLVFGALLAVISSILLFRFDDDLAYENMREKSARDIELAEVEQPLRTPSVVGNDLDIEYDYSDEDDAAVAKMTEASALLVSDEPEEGYLLKQDVRFLCFRSHHVPWILFVSDFIISNGAGMTINFFPLFFMQEYGLTPIHMCLLFVCQPLVVMVLSILAQKVSTTIGRMPVIASTRILSVLCLMAMSVGKPLWLEITFFLMRGGMMRCSQPLRRSLLMDYVPKNVRARWNALEGLSVFSWSGSAVLGGYIIDAYSYRMCFMITSAVYCVGLGLELFLLPLTRHAMEKKTSTAQ